MSSSASPTTATPTPTAGLPLNSPTAGSDPAPSTVQPSKLKPIRPPQSRSQQQQPAATTTATAAAARAPTSSDKPSSLPAHSTTSHQLQPTAGTASSGDTMSGRGSGSGSGSGGSGTSSSAPAPPAAPVQVTPALPHWFVVFYAIIKDTDGRDKALKALQYGMRYVRWLMKQSPHRTQQVVAISIALTQLVTGRALLASSSKQQHATDTVVTRLPAAAISLPAATAMSASTAAAGSTTAATVDVPLLLSHITVPLSLVEQLIAASTQRLELLSGTFSTIRKGIRLFKWCYTVPAAHKNYHRFVHDYQTLQQHYKLHGGPQQHSSSGGQSIAHQPPVTPLLLPGLPPLPLLATVELVNSVLAILTDMSDDVDWYSKHLLLPKRWNATAARTTIVLWFVTVLVDLSLSTRTAAIQYQQLQDAELELERASSGTHTNSTAATAEPQRVQQLAAARAARGSVLYGSVLTWLKFFFDFGVALPSVLEQQTEREGLVQAMGCMSALVATYKLILAVK